MTESRGGGRRALLGAAAGVLAAGAALGIGQLVAGLTGASGSPVVAVGQLQIDFTPPWLKNFAITAFGPDDKLVLVSGILVVIAIFAAVIGVAAMRRLAYGMTGLAVFAAVGLTAAATRPTATVTSLLPTLAAVAAAVVVLRVLIGRARTVTPGISGPSAASGPPAAREERTLSAPDMDQWVKGPAEAAAPSGGTGPAPGAARRSFLAASAATAGVAAAAGLAGRSLAERGSVAGALKTLRLPRPSAPPPALPAGTDLRIPGLAPFITANSDFYRVDTALVLPEVVPSSWQLRIHGMVAREITITFDELLRRPLIEDYVTLCCVSNPVAGPYIGNALWLGASLASLLRQAGIKAGADQLICTSADGFTSGTPVQTVMDGRDALLAVAMNGQPLPVAHGFPVRMVVPGLYGYVSATKWVTDINVTTFAGNYAYWAQRGWSQRAPIKTESRIDVPGGQNRVRAGRTAVAGVAWAQHKGIDAVEVRVDRGPWHQARLAAVPGIDTWRQWVWDWEATSGNHLIEARATDATGYTQTAAQEPPEPNGATGYPSVQVSVA
ncbi:MAG: molybdopterin-dependent oxidoreductase [Streptosporangiaceae bacterium]|nr:molybdopterin-dependent oxidoreductase [Streptosporangiaceae bacterium]